MTIIWIAIILISAFVAYTKKEYRNLFIVFVVGAIVGLLLSAAHIYALLQVAAAIIVGVISYFLLKDEKDPVHLPIEQEVQPEDQYIGQLGIVTKSIGRRELGQVSVLKKIFNAKDIKNKGIIKGEYVRVKYFKDDIVYVELAGGKKNNHQVLNKVKKAAKQADIKKERKNNA